MNILPVYPNTNGEVIALKKSRIVAACLTGAGVLAAAAVFGASQLNVTEPSPSPQLSSYSTAKPETSQESASSFSSTVETEANTAPKYRISVYGEYVAVYELGRELPCQILETRVDSLPEYDQQLLREGIAAKDDKELNQMLQDYES